MKKFNELNETNSTVIEWEGKVLKTTDTPYIMQNSSVLYEEELYNAPAIDGEGNEYVIYWEINHPDFENLEDESEACDWDNPLKVIRM